MNKCLACGDPIEETAEWCPWCWRLWMRNRAESVERLPGPVLGALAHAALHEPLPWEGDTEVDGGHL